MSTTELLDDGEPRLVEAMEGRKLARPAIYTMRPDGSDVVRLTSTPGNDAHAAWSPDGQWIVFASARGGFKDEAVLHPYNPQPTGDLYVMRADGSDVRALTDDQFEDGTPTWMPVLPR